MGFVVGRRRSGNARVSDPRHIGYIRIDAREFAGVALAKAARV